VINVREGVRREDDQLPARLTQEPIKTGPSRGQRVQDFEKMKDEFYQVCGWDLNGNSNKGTCGKTGYPLGFGGNSVTSFSNKGGEDNEIC